MKKYIFLLSLFVLIPFSQNTQAQENSPIVQIVAYKDIFGKYFQMIGWGSASLIDQNGTIITNNHVVDNGKGGAYEYFNICISLSDQEKPTCNYSATLIERDTKKDIALLRINPLNIYGEKVDFTKLKTVETDFTYVPKSGDQIEAVGFPWVGSETITKTQGIVSGTSSYNDATYIKTDTLIAGGNSGGAFLKDGKLIGIPTFGIGGFTDPSIGYGLLIKETKDFISENSKKDFLINESTEFNKYKRLITDTNIEKSIDDLLLKVHFNDSYKVTDYIPSKAISFEPAKQNSQIPQSITIALGDLPDIKTQDEFLYILQDLGYYYKDSQKLKKISIGGISFFQPVQSYDASSGETSAERYYYAFVGGKLLSISGNLGYSEGEDIIKKVSSEFDTFLKNIEFNQDTISQIRFGLKLEKPFFQIKESKKIVYSELLGGVSIYPFGNLHEYIGIYLSEQDIYSGKGQSINDIYTSETKDVSPNMKSKIRFLGYEGYIICSDTANVYKGVQTDEKGNYLNQSSCSIKVFGIESGQEKYILLINLLTDKKNIKSGLDTLIKILPNTISLKSVGTGETKLVNIYKNQTKLLFTDLRDQSELYKAKLNLLIKYKLLENTSKLDPYKPLKWGEYIDTYLSQVYKIDLGKNSCKKTDSRCRLKSYKINLGKETKSIAYLLNSIGMKIDHYVDSSKIFSINDLLDLVILARIDPRTLSEEWLAKYAVRKNEKEFEDITKKVQEGFFNLYGTKKISLYDLGEGNYDTFWTSKTLHYSAKKGILEVPYYNSGKLDMSKRDPSLNFPDITLYYPVLTKAEAIDQIAALIDFGLFDSELAKKKESTIEQ